MHKRKNSLFSFRRYILYFVVLCIVISVSALLLLRSVHVDSRVIGERAVYAFLNIIFLSFALSMIEGAWRRVQIKRPVDKILETTERLAKGDFNARIELTDSLFGSNELTDISEHINTMAEELSGIETMRTDFVSNVSHEIKTPLAVINNYSELLKEPGVSEEERRQYVEAISQSVNGLSDLVTNILRLNKLENQKIYLDEKKYDLGEQLCECLIGFENIWEEKHIELETDIDDEVVVQKDPSLMTLVWNNLLSNAFKFTPDGGKVTVSVKREGEDAVVTVSDTGCGISAENGKHIFDKFYQGDTSHATRGNGLGLALVKRVIEISGAKINVSSKVGAGTTITVRIDAGER